jgi:hypothetical protein
MYRNLWCTWTEKESGIGYHYCISETFSVEAYKTEKGYNEYLKRTGLVPELVREGIDSRTGGQFKTYRLNGQYNEKGFWSIDEIPADAKQFKGLSNGHYVDCYCATVDGIPTIFRPNPNAKEVYKPGTIQEHIYLASLN